MDGDTATRRSWLSPAVVALAMVGLAVVNLAWGLGTFLNSAPGEMGEIRRMLAVGHLVVAVLAVAAAVLGVRATVGAAAVVRAVAIGCALYFVPLLSWTHLFSDRFGLLARWGEAPMQFHPVDVEAASVLLALVALIAMGRHGAGGEGTEFAPHRFRRSLLVGITGMASIAVFVSIFAGLGIYRNGVVATGAMAIVFALIAHGMLRLRAWTIPAAVAVGVFATIAAFTTRAPAPFLAVAALTPVVLLPLMVALVRAVWAPPAGDDAA